MEFPVASDDVIDVILDDVIAGKFPLQFDLIFQHCHVVRDGGVSDDTTTAAKRGLEIMVKVARSCKRCHVEWQMLIIEK